MIISASYRTDIPAFYADWFLNRLRAGYCMTRNPYSNAPIRIDLTRDAVDGFVFWTRNIGPFFPALDVVRQEGFPSVVQYTITGYPRDVESSVVPAERSIENVRRLAEDYGRRTCVWRYDTILFSSLTRPDFHRKNFEAIARKLEGSTDEVVLSFAQIYRKTRTNLTRAAAQFGFVWDDPSDDVKCSMAEELAAIAKSCGMQATICSQRRYLGKELLDAKCIDAERLSDVAGKRILAARKGNRPECGCYESRDIGAYDTCPHGCVYCYAVQNKAAAQRRYREHDSRSEYLIAGS